MCAFHNEGIWRAQHRVISDGDADLMGGCWRRFDSCFWIGETAETKIMRPYNAVRHRISSSSKFILHPYAISLICTDTGNGDKWSVNFRWGVRHGWRCSMWWNRCLLFSTECRMYLHWCFLSFLQGFCWLFILSIRWVTPAMSFHQLFVKELKHPSFEKETIKRNRLHILEKI